MDAHAGYVFGYGSLTAGPGKGCVAELSGFRRGWGVAMDNSVALPGYKRYRDARGELPAVFVAFLDIAPAAAGERVNGVCLPVDVAALRALDERERNYERVEVGAALGPLGAAALPGLGAATPVWAYVGSPAGRARLREGTDRGTAVIHDGYLDAVRRGFASLGAAESARCARSLDPGTIPVAALAREDAVTPRPR